MRIRVVSLLLVGARRDSAHKGEWAVGTAIAAVGRIVHAIGDDEYDESRAFASRAGIDGSLRSYSGVLPAAWSENGVRSSPGMLRRRAMEAACYTAFGDGTCRVAQGFRTEDPIGYGFHSP